MYLVWLNSLFAVVVQRQISVTHQSTLFCFCKRNTTYNWIYNTSAAASCSVITSSSRFQHRDMDRSSNQTQKNKKSIFHQISNYFFSFKEADYITHLSVQTVKQQLKPGGCNKLIQKQNRKHPSLMPSTV